MRLSACLLPLFLLLLGTCQTSRAQNAYTANPGLVYATVDGKDLVLDLYVPTAASPTFPPVVLWIHGGAWSHGTRQDNITNALNVLAGKGIALATLEYRLSNAAKWPAQLHDCKGAVRWLRANAAKYALDPARVGAWGESAGAHLAAMLGTAHRVGPFKAEGKDMDLEGNVGGNLLQLSSVQAVCDYYGPTDFLRSNSGGAFNYDVKAATFPPAVLIGGIVPDHPELCASASPLTFVGKEDPPFLILHGSSDAEVQPMQSRWLDSALTKAGVSSTLQVFQGAGHGGAVFWSAATAKTVSEFFTARLLPGPDAIRGARFVAPGAPGADEVARDAAGRARDGGKRPALPVFRLH